MIEGFPYSSYFQILCDYEKQAMLMVYRFQYCSVQNNIPSCCTYQLSVQNSWLRGLSFTCILLAGIFVPVLYCTTFISSLCSSANCIWELDNNFIAIWYRDLGHRVETSLESCKFITTSKGMLKQHILEITAAWETSAQITFAKQFSDSLEFNITFNKLEPE